MEQYGIYYFFEHQDGKHKMILANSFASHSKIKDLPTIKYNIQIVGYNRAEQHLHSWISNRRFCTGKVELRDYDYLQPNVLQASKDAEEKYARSKFEVYDYPGKYDKKQQKTGDLFAQVRLEAEQALDRRRIANGDAPSLFAGGIVKLEKHPTSKENDDYLVVRASHQYGVQSYGSAQGAHAPGYQGDYEFLPRDRPFRSLPLTPKPRIHGIQTAKVVNEKDKEQEEISTDKNGHIWVQFYWDRKSEKSCPIRVSQSWAGKRWGEQFIPRVGMEVVVEFLEGDPDRPIVTGCVYNGENELPYTLPSDKTQSGLKSHSSKGITAITSSCSRTIRTKNWSACTRRKITTSQCEFRETWTIGEAFMPGASRTTTLENGDDSLTIKKGNRSIEISLGGQSTHALAKH